MLAHVLHPARRVVRGIDQQVRELRIALALRDAHQVFAEGFLRILGNTVMETGIFLLRGRDEPVELFDLVENEAQDGAAEMRVAAALFFRRFLQQDDALRAVFPGRHGRRASRIAAAYNDDVVHKPHS